MLTTMTHNSSSRRLVFLLTGQSNMAGRGPLADAPPPLHATATADERIAAFSQRGTNTAAVEAWGAAAEPLHADKPDKVGVGPGVAFARALLRLAPPAVVPAVGLVPCAWGGSELARWEEGGDLLEEAVRRTRASLREGDTLAGILWHQGESDCGDLESATSHSGRMVRALQVLRDRLGSPMLPVVLGELGYFLDQADECFKHAATVNAGTLAAPAQLGAAACVSAHGLAHKGDRLHFGTKAQLALGERYALAWLRLAHAGGVATASDGAAEPAAPFGFPVGADACDAVATDEAIID